MVIKSSPNKSNVRKKTSRFKKYIKLKIGTSDIYEGTLALMRSVPVICSEKQLEIAILYLSSITEHKTDKN